MEGMILWLTVSLVATVFAVSIWWTGRNHGRAEIMELVSLAVAMQQEQAVGMDGEDAYLSALADVLMAFDQLLREYRIVPDRED